MFPCGAKLPDISMVIAGLKVVVPGIKYVSSNPYSRSSH
jgi:hypothetical protein